MDVPGEDDLIGAGIHFCATCDGPFYKDQHVIVVGGGNSGVEEGLFLTKFASRVTLLERGERLRASQVLQPELPISSCLDPSNAPSSTRAIVVSLTDAVNHPIKLTKPSLGVVS